VVGLVVALVEGPVYACICLAFFPVLFLTLACFGKSLKKSAAMKIEQSRALGGIVEENLSAIKLIVSFAQEKKAC
jgi:ABC-type multidrug transport system fused ATPase/permease subunit